MKKLLFLFIIFSTLSAYGHTYSYTRDELNLTLLIIKAFIEEEKKIVEQLTPIQFFDQIPAISDKLKGIDEQIDRGQMLIETLLKEKKITQAEAESFKEAFQEKKKKASLLLEQALKRLTH